MRQWSLSTQCVQHRRHAEFTEDPISEQVLFKILDNARFAPNGGNRQAWHVTVVRDAALKHTIADLWDLALRENHVFHGAGLVPFVASEAFWRNPPGGPSRQPIDLDVARATPLAAGVGATPEFVAAAPVLLVVSLDLTQVTAADSGLGRLSISAGASVYPFAQNILLAGTRCGIRRADH